MLLAPTAPFSVIPKSGLVFPEHVNNSGVSAGSNANDKTITLDGVYLPDLANNTGGKDCWVTLWIAEHTTNSPPAYNDLKVDYQGNDEQQLLGSEIFSRASRDIILDLTMIRPPNWTGSSVKFRFGQPSSAADFDNVAIWNIELSGVTSLTPIDTIEYESTSDSDYNFASMDCSPGGLAMWIGMMDNSTGAAPTWGGAAASDANTILEDRWEPASIATVVMIKKTYGTTTGTASLDMNLGNTDFMAFGLTFK